MYMPRTKKRYRKQFGGSSLSSLEEKASHPDYKNPVQLLLDCWSKNTKLTYSEALRLWPPLARIPTKELPLRWRGHVRQTSNRPPPVPPRRRKQAPNRPPPVPPRRKRQRSKNTNKKKGSKSPKKKGSKSPKKKASKSSKKKGSKSPKKKATKSKKSRSFPPIPAHRKERAKQERIKKFQQELEDEKFARMLDQQEKEEEEMRKKQEEDGLAAAIAMRKQGWS